MADPQTITVDPSQLDAPQTVTVDPGQVQPYTLRQKLSDMLPDAKTAADWTTNAAREFVDRATRPALGFGQRGVGEQIVQPWAQTAGKAVEQFGEPLRKVPAGGSLLDFLEAAIGKAGELAGGTLEFGSSPAGLATGAVATLGPAAQNALRAGFGAYMANQARPEVAEAFRKPTPENLGRALVGTGAAVLPVVPELAGARPLKGLESAIERHNLEADRLVEQERMRPNYSTEQGQQILGTETMPVKVGNQTVEVRPAGESSTGRPYYSVVDPQSGKPVYGGYGEAVQGWLRMRGARPLNEEVPREARYAESQPGGAEVANPPAARKLAAAPEIPATGVEERVARVQDARDRLAQQLTGRSFKDLANSERLVVDEFVNQGYGFAVQPAKEESNANQRQPSEQGRETKAPEVSPEQVARVEPAAQPERQPVGGAQPSLPEAKPQEVAPVPAPQAAAPQQTRAEKPPAYGHEVGIAVPGEATHYPARYAVREASDVYASHNPQSFEPNPAYEHQNDRDYSQAGNAARVIENSAPGTFDPEYTTTESQTAEHGAPVIDQRGNVLGGNNRTMTIQRVYARGGAQADAYRQAVQTKAAQFGVNPLEVGKLQQPVLVRELLYPVESQQAQIAITDFNKTGAAQLSPGEQAVTDGRRITDSTAGKLAARVEDTGEDSTLAQALQGDRGAEVLNELVNDGVFTRQEANGYVDERGFLTPDAKDRIAKMIVGRLFQSPADYSRTPPELRAKLDRVAPQVLRVESREGWGITPLLRQAVGALQDAQAHGIQNLDDLARQTDLSGETRAYSTDALAIAKKLQEGPLAAQRAFRQYANEEAMSRPGAQTSLYEPPSREEAFASAFGGDRGGGQMAREIDRPRQTPSSRRNTWADADWEKLPERADRPPRIRLNEQAAVMVTEALHGTNSTKEIHGVQVNSSSGSRLAKNIRRMAEDALANGHVELPEATKAYRLADEIEEAANNSRGVVVYESSARFPLRERAATLREELTHQLQDQVEAGRDAEAFRKQARKHIATRIAEPALKRAGYALDDRTVVNEVAAKITAGRARELGIPAGVADSFLKHYGETLDRHFGAGAANTVLRHVDRSVRMETQDASSGKGPRPPPVRRDARQALSGDAGKSAGRSEGESQGAGTVAPRERPGPSGKSVSDTEGAGTRGDVEGTPKKGSGERGAANLGAVTLGLDKFVTEDVVPTAKEAVGGFVEAADDILKILAPAARGRDAKTAALVMRNRLAELARRSDQAEASLAKAKKFFDHRKAEDNYAFIDKMENGEPQGSAELDAIARVFRTMLDQRRAEVQALGKGKLEQFYENYFPHVWQNPKRAQGVFQSFFSRRPLEGSKSFLKQRTHPLFKDGMDAGLKPVSDNPVDLVILKSREMDRYIMAHQVLEDWKQAGLAKFIDARRGKHAAGWMKIDDPIGTVYGPSVQQIAEYPNEAVYDALSQVAQALGIEHKRGFKMPGPGLGYAYEGTGQVKTRHGTAEDVLAHEIGHQLEWKYGLSDQLMKHPDLKTRVAIKRELRDLADLRNARKDYRRSRDEKMAAIAQAWAGAREEFQRVAPTVYAEWTRFLNSHAELKPLRDLHGGMNAKLLAQPYDVGGLVIRGHWWAPEGAARIMNNYLAPGLRAKSGAFRAALGLNNVLNQFQLGLSAFHLGFTSADAAVSKAALGFEGLMRGKPVGAAKAFASVPAAPLTTFLQGNRILKEWYKPGSQGGEIGKIVDGLAAAGGRAHMDEYYQTRIAERMRMAWRHGNWFGALLRTPFAAVEGVSNVIMRDIVPRQKLGVFADLARFEMERLGPGATFDQTREALAKVWDSVENRMGQLTYDNLFWDRTAKDIAMIGARSVGWNLGTIREIGGGALDLVKEPLKMAAGGPPEGQNLHRIAYLMGLTLVSAMMGALYQYIATGQGPEELKDYFFPRTGQLDQAGRPQRASLPTYVKDVYHYFTEPGRTLANKVAPVWNLFAEMVRNEDYYGNKIRNEDDPLVKQMADEARHAVGGFEPFGFRYWQQQTKLGAPLAQRAQQFVGITPAPSALEKTPAERLAGELARTHIPAGGRTREQAERRDAQQDITRLARQGQNYAQQARDYLSRGVLTGRDIKLALTRARVSPLAGQFQRLGLADALKVWDAATPEERTELRPFLAKKARALRSEPAELEQTLAPKVAAALGGR